MFQINARRTSLLRTPINQSNEISASKHTQEGGPLHRKQQKSNASMTTESAARQQIDEQFETKNQVDTSYLPDEEYQDVQSYWEASNYLSTAQIYLKENPLLSEPLKADHIKPRLLGHFGTSVGLNLVYTHLNRVIRKKDLDVLFVTGPGHGGPANVAQTYMEGTYSEVYPKITQNSAGLKALFRQFSTPGGIPSHASANTPGSINEGGELGYCLVHAFGAVFDNPNLIAATVVGDGEAETGPLEGSWKCVNFLNPIRDGAVAVLPILHLNGYKISGPTVYARYSDERLSSLFRGHGYDVHIVAGDDPKMIHNLLAKTLDIIFDRIREIQKKARESKTVEDILWPMIVLRTPKGWTGPVVVDGKQVQGTFRSHQVPLTEVRNSEEHLRLLESWLKSYHPDQHFTSEGDLKQRLKEFAPKGERRMGAKGNTGIPDFKRYAYEVKAPGSELKPSTVKLGELMRDIYAENPTNFRLFCPDETNSNKLGAVFDTQDRCLVSKILENDEKVSPNGRVMEVLSEHLCHGWLEGYNLTGRHGLFATYEAFALIVGSMAAQHAKWLEVCIKELPWRKPIPSFNILLTSTCWRNDHNGFSHQGPGLMDVILNKKSSVARIYLPPDANCLLSVADHCFRSTNYINTIIIDKQPQLQYLNMEDAIAHCAAGAGIWEWANSKGLNGKPDIVMASAGDIPTQELLAAVDWLHKNAPELKLQVVNVVDLMSLYHPDQHPHGMRDERFNQLFFDDVEVVFAFHGYTSAVHHIIHGRNQPQRFHVRGYQENGTTTTPFMMTILNEISRFHLAQLAIKKTKSNVSGKEALLSKLQSMITDSINYAYQHFEDSNEISRWKWQSSI
ncbi:phosphoketolase [Planoprotostelium fungivorum]|uniref:Phosphoketolase n=1 Tax=Planoprotostelium fungivorum TaxID=1890364 RepID=A0A2P6NRG2_9EUKA|nr:phosphoketolase [Planoprotostelium fungivorum]